jgi:hypothetical protein
MFQVTDASGAYSRVEANIALHSWVHIAAEFSNGTLRLFLDGALAAEATGTVYPFAPLEAGGGFVLGNTVLPDNFPLNGLMDEVAAYSRALSPEEAHALYLLGGAKLCPVGADPATLTAEQRDALIQVGCLPPYLHKAKGTAQVVGGYVVGVTLSDGGYGYTSAPVVRVVGGGGSGATATAVVKDGVVVAIEIESTGKGYTSVPRVLIGSPNRPPALRIRTTRVAIDFDLVLGHHYQLLSSSDLSNWSPVAEDFIAEEEQLTKEFDTGPGPTYYRLAELP